MFRLLQVQDAGHVHPGPPWDRCVSRYVTLRSHAICTGDAFHHARLRGSCARFHSYISKVFTQLLYWKNDITIDTTIMDRNMIYQAYQSYRRKRKACCCVLHSSSTRTVFSLVRLSLSLSQNTPKTEQLSLACTCL